MGSIGSLVFTGISSFSSDFQSILDRANSIAQLPIKKLQNTESDNLSKKQALIALNPAVASLGSAVAALGMVASNQGLTASSSDSSTVSVVNTGATSPATYTISNIQSVAKSAWATSTDFTGDPRTAAVSASGQVSLAVGANTYVLQLTSQTNNLNGLRDAINNSGAAVTASILTSGTDHYLALSAVNTGQAAIQLHDIPKVDLITNTGSGSETSLVGYANPASTPVSATGKIDLVAGSTTYHLDITGNNYLNGLVNAISNAGAGLTASVSNISGSNYLTVSGASSIALNDLQAPVNLVSNSSAGSNADFLLNGTVHVVRSSNTVNDIIPGVSFTLKGTTGPVTLSLTSDQSQLSSALQNFVSGYNALLDQVDQQIGSSAGPLGGDFLVRSINSDMQQLASYWNTGASSIRSLSDLGVTFEDTTGHLSFSANTFNSLSATQMSDAYKFLGSSQSGLAALASNFSQLSDPVLGMIRVQEDSYDATNTQLTNQISALQDRANVAKTAMTAKIQAADALVARLQSQQNMVNASVSSLNYVLYGKQTNLNGL